MGLVLAFAAAPRPASRQPARRRETPPPSGADILFFTGVRYERHVAAPEGGSATAARDGLLPPVQ
jgi:hypothetical protein